ncbi:MAG: S-layer homology domain-containing protein [Chamaesiphon sp.]|nr:S-layer homology domain-containing protein [Chamaesiphon sp.]
MINLNSRKALIFSTSAIACSSALVIISAYFSDDSAAVLAAASFPDTQNYWAQPFIKSLADRNIVTGYPDNTFRPLKAVNRDEFAAILQKAFNQKAERQIASGSTFTDVPNGYWAAADIKSAYEMGFMKGYPNGEFRPKQPISKLEVIVALARNLKLPTTRTAVNNNQTATNPPIAAAPTATSLPVPVPVATPQIQSAPPQRNRQQMMPMALTTLMQPFMMTPARSVAATTPTTPVAANDNPTPAPTQTAPNPAVVVPITKQPLSPSMVVNKYYQDAAKIPADAIADVAEATTAGIVINYPNLRLLNPNQAATRGEISAMIHRALASQGKLPPITDPAAVKYIVN